MTKDYARDFWKKHLQVISRDGSSAAVENPACEFTKRAKAGEYDSLTDEEYNIALKT